MSRSTHQPQPIFSKIILTKAQLAEHIKDTCNVSQRTAYRMLSGERKFINSYEYDCVLAMVAERIDQLKQAV